MDLILRQVCHEGQKRTLCLELKIVPTDRQYWASNWRAVYKDLARPDYPGRTTPEADFAVCFLIDRPYHPQKVRNPEDVDRWEQIPDEGDSFRPVPSDDSLPPLQLFSGSPVITVGWQHPTLEAERYETRMRVLWLKAGDG